MKKKRVPCRNPNCNKTVFPNRKWKKHHFCSTICEKTVVAVWTGYSFQRREVLRSMYVHSKPFRELVCGPLMRMPMKERLYRGKSGHL